MQKLLRMLVLACGVLTLLTHRANAQSDDELVFGVYPFLSPSKIVEQFAPLASHLSTALGRKVTLRSAPDFTRFIERTRAGEYDIIFTAPHMGRLAEKRDGYRRIAQTGYQITVVTVARQDGPVHSLADLKGRTIAIGAKLSMTYQVTDHALNKHGLALERDVKFIDPASFSNVVEAIMRGEADAGSTITMLWDVASAEQRSNLREIFRGDPVPGFLVLAHPRLGNPLLKRVERAFLDFPKTAAGNTYFEKTRQIDFRPLDDATMKRIDPFTAVFGLTPR